MTLESLPDPVVAEYSGLAARYDSRWRHYVDATTTATLARMEVPARGRVLDIGCGTGVLLERLAARNPEAALVGVDLVPAMLAVARTRVAPGTLLAEGRAEALPYDDRAFDVVVSSSVFHYIPEPLAALLEIRRVLKPGGQLVLTDWCRDYLTVRACELWLRWAGQARVRAYRARECLQWLAQAGYTDARAERYRIDWRWGLMTITARNLT